MTVIGMRGARVLAAAAAGTLTFGLMIAGGEAAHADAAPTATDVVGVGSDTLQYMLDFGADGDYKGGAGNNAGKLDRLVSFDATPDANARAGYLRSTANALNPTIVLRAGTSPVLRPNGSGAGITALLNDKSSGAHVIDFARSSGTLSAQQVATAKADGGVGNLRVIRLATDGLAMAAGTTTNAPSLSRDQLKAIYACDASLLNTGKTGPVTFDEVGGTSTNAIVPVLPQAGSGTRNTFLKDIGFVTNADGSTSPTLGGCLKFAEENDPFALYITDAGVSADTANPNAIEPISEGRLNLYKQGYFKNPAAPFGTNPAALAPTVKIFTGTSNASDAKPLYDNERPLFVIFRDSDVNSTSKYNGSTLNWARTFFYNPGGTQPFFAGPKGQALLASAGVTPAYANCGPNSISASDCTG